MEAIVRESAPRPGAAAASPRFAAGSTAPVARVLVMALLLVVAASCRLGSTATAASPAPTVILISMDGTRPADLDGPGLPALARMQREGARAKAMTPVFPSNTFPNHVTLATGVSPDRHGIVNNVFIDPDRGRYSYDGDPTWLEAEPLWSIVAGHGLTSASYYWVGSEGKWRSGRGPAHWKAFSSRTDESEKVDEVLRWLDLPGVERPNLVTVWFHGADRAGHRHGPGSEEVQESLREQDVELARLFAALDAKAAWSHTTVLVVSDHGMRAIEGSIDLADAFDEADIEAKIHGGGGFVTITLEDDGDLAAAVDTARKAGLEAWAQGQGPVGFETRNPRFGDLVALAPPGLAISPSSMIGRLRASFMGGGHGYRPEDPSMAAIFLALGRGVDAGVVPGPVGAVDVAPTVLSLLGLPIPEEMEGRPINLRGVQPDAISPDPDGGSVGPRKESH